MGYVLVCVLSIIQPQRNLFYRIPCMCAVSSVHPCLEVCCCFTSLSRNHSMVQHPVLESFSKVNNAALVAASKTSSTPSPVSALHSKYFLAPICLDTASACCGITNGRDFFRISSRASGSSRRSFFNPTRIIGTPGQRSLASSTHYNTRLASNPLSYCECLPYW